jgi:hypothetical protein
MFILLKPEDHEDEQDRELAEIRAEHRRIYAEPDEEDEDERLSPKSGPTSVIDQPALAVIDPPSPYDTLETWERYLRELKKLPENVLLGQESIAEAEHEIRRKREGSASMARSRRMETNEDRESSIRPDVKGFAQNSMSDAERDDRDTEKQVRTPDRLINRVGPRLKRPPRR